MSNLTPFAKFMEIVHHVKTVVGISGNKEHGNYRVYTYKKISLEGELVVNQMRAVTAKQYSTPDMAIEAAYAELVQPIEIEYGGWQWDLLHKLWRKGTAYVREEDGRYCFFSLVVGETEIFAWVDPEAISGFEELRTNNPYLLPPTEKK